MTAPPPATEDRAETLRDPPSQHARRGRTWCLWIVPLALVALAAVRAPTFGRYCDSLMYDPEYAYLFNGLMVLEGTAPAHIHHPGTPVQVFIAAVIAVRYALAGQEESPRLDVVAHPEAYLRTAWVLILGAVILSGAYLGASIRRLTGSLAAACLCQAALFTSIGVIEAAERTNPEPLLIACVMLLGGRLLRIAATPLPETRRARRIEFGTVGALMGLAAAIKITVLPVAAAIILLGRRPRWKAAAFIVSGATFLIAVLPVASRWEAFFRWVSNLFWANRRYGQGARTIINPELYAKNLGEMVALEPALTAAIVLGSVVVVAGAVAAWRDPARDTFRRTRRLFAGVVAAQALTFAMGAKVPESRYVIAGSTLLVVHAAALWYLAGRLPPGWPRFARGALALFIAGGVAFQAFQVVGIDRVRAERARSRARAAAAVERLEPDARIMLVYGSLGEPAALLFAVAWAGERFGDEITSRHPRFVLARISRPFQYGRHRFPPESLRDMVGPGPLYALIPPIVPQRRDLDPLKLELIEDFGWERLYRAYLPDELADRRPATRPAR